MSEAPVWSHISRSAFYSFGSFTKKGIVLPEEVEPGKELQTETGDPACIGEPWVGN